MEYKDYYKILNVPKDADEKTIKRAYRKMAREYHPDKNPGNKAAEEKFKVINEAYEVLGSAENRSRYDQLGRNYYRYQQMGGNPTDFTDTSSNNTKVVISYSDSTYHFTSVNWTLTKVSTVNNDNMLDENEIFSLTVDLSCLSYNGTSVKVGAYQRFLLEVKPPTGAILAVERTVPGRVSAMVNLY